MNPITRRSFLGRVAVAIGAAAVVPALPSVQPEPVKALPLPELLEPKPERAKLGHIHLGRGRLEFWRRGECLFSTQWPLEVHEPLCYPPIDVSEVRRALRLNSPLIANNQGFSSLADARAWLAEHETSHNIAHEPTGR